MIIFFDEPVRRMSALEELARANHMKFAFSHHWSLWEPFDSLTPAEQRGWAGIHPPKPGPKTYHLKEIKTVHDWRRPSPDPKRGAFGQAVRLLREKAARHRRKLSTPPKP